MKKICVYTCVTGNYDEINEFKNFKEKNIDYYLFTNNKNIKSSFWNVIYIEDESLDNIRLARKIKILGHEIINSKYDYSIWIDGNIILKTFITEFLKECDLDKYDIVGFKHQIKDCIYDECKDVIRFKKDDKKTIQKQEEFLLKENYPKHNGLIESTVFVRNLKSENVKKTCELWFEMILKFSTRDQLSFNYAAYKNNLKYKLLDMNVFENKYFTSKKHIIPKKIEKYRLYFGDDSNLDDFNYDLDFQGKYKIKGNKYIIDVKCPIDTDKIKLEICKCGGIKLNEISLNSKSCKYELINGFLFDEKNCFFTYDPQIYILGNFKKNQSVFIEINVEIISELEEYQILNNLNNKINIINIENNNLKTEFNKLKIENNSLKNSILYKITLPFRKLKRKLKKKS